MRFAIAGYTIHFVVAVEQIVANARAIEHGCSADELPSGWQMEKVFGAPATGTADAFPRDLGRHSSVAGLALLLLL